MRYFYKAKKNSQIIEGTIEADNSAQVIVKLEQQGLTPVKISTQAEGAIKKVTKASSTFSSRQKVTAKDINIFTRQLSSMMRSKVPILRGLELLARETQSVAFRKVISSVASEVQQGKQLSEALAKYPNCFSRIYVNMVASGEKTGVLDNMLLRLSEFADWEEDIKSKITSALAYPLFMLFMGIVSVIVMVTFIVPRLTKLFSDTGQVLPWPTQALIETSHFVQNYWYWLIAGIVFVIFVAKQLKIIEKNRVAIDRQILKIPIVGTAILHSDTARFCRTLSLLLTYRIPIRDAFEVAIPTIGNRAIEKELSSVSRDLSLGMSVSRSLVKVSYFQGFVISLVAVGEEGGRLGEAFGEIAASYERELNTEIKVVSSLLEPILILSIGLVIGAMIMAMLLPILDFNVG